MAKWWLTVASVIASAAILAGASTLIAHEGDIKVLDLRVTVVEEQVTDKLDAIDKKLELLLHKK